MSEADPELPMVNRFQRSRWSPVRRRLDAMRPGQVAKFGASDYHNAKASVARLNDAYGGERLWKLTQEGRELSIRHTASQVSPVSS